MIMKKYDDGKILVLTVNFFGFLNFVEFFLKLNNFMWKKLEHFLNH